jgi:hypothetical protein
MIFFCPICFIISSLSVLLLSLLPLPILLILSYRMFFMNWFKPGPFDKSTTDVHVETLFGFPNNSQFSIFKSPILPWGRELVLTLNYLESQQNLDVKGSVPQNCCIFTHQPHFGSPGDLHFFHTNYSLKVPMTLSVSLIWYSDSLFRKQLYLQLPLRDKQMEESTRQKAF